jgi:hypothetical protein
MSYFRFIKRRAQRKELYVVKEWDTSADNEMEITGTKRS